MYGQPTIVTDFNKLEPNWVKLIDDGRRQHILIWLVRRLFRETVHSGISPFHHIAGRLGIDSNRLKANVKQVSDSSTSTC